MARRIRDELRYADGELRRFVNSQVAEFRRIGYPRMAAFAKDIARGTISLAPTPEDEGMEWVGRFLWTCCNQVEREVAFRYATTGWSYGFLNMNIHQFNYKKGNILKRLDSYLRGVAEAASRAAAA